MVSRHTEGLRVVIQSLWPPDPCEAPREQPGQADGTSCWRVRCSALTAVVYYSRSSPGIRLMANIKAVPGILEQQECGWRSSPMNSAFYMGQTPSARCVNAHYQFMQPLNAACFSSIFFLVFKESWASSLFFNFFSFSFLSMNFRQFKLPLNDKQRVPRWKKVPCVWSI